MDDSSVWDGDGCEVNLDIFGTFEWRDEMMIWGFVNKETELYCGYDI